MTGTFPFFSFAPVSTVPSKCADPAGAGTTSNPCTEPGTLPRCQLCPNSSDYWRRTEQESAA